jgi:hypothetical protein
MANYEEYTLYWKPTFIDTGSTDQLITQFIPVTSLFKFIHPGATNKYVVTSISIIPDVDVAVLVTDFENIPLNLYTQFPNGEIIHKNIHPAP